MMRSQILKGSLLIGAAACCYGMLGTFVKLAYLAGYNTAEVTVSQFVMGFLGLMLISLTGTKKNNGDTSDRPIKGSYLRMAASGISLGLTSIFYYLAVRHIPVSIAIVLLLQSVWMSIVLESIINKRRPGILKAIAILVILMGTILATGTHLQGDHFNMQGVMWGLAAAACYTATMYSSNNVELQLPPMKRSFLMISGGLIIVLLVFTGPIIQGGFSPGVFLSWGLLVSLFGTILPPILFTRGMPLIGMGLGAILTSLEVPVSIIFAHFMLGESTSLLQWSGVILILFAVMMINLQQLRISGTP